MAKVENSIHPIPEYGSALRSSYISDISFIAPLDDLEATDKQKTLEWLTSSSTIHKPANMNQHLGVLFLLLSHDRASTFLINHRKAQMWIPPGGHVDEGQTFQEAVKLEMQEELQTEPVFISQKPFFITQTLTSGVNSGHIDVTAWFQVEGDESIVYNIQEKEASEGRWFKIADLAKMPTRGHLPRAAQKLQIPIFLQQ